MGAKLQDCWAAEGAAGARRHGPCPDSPPGAPDLPSTHQNGHKAGRKMAHLPVTAEELMEDLKDTLLTL